MVTAATGADEKDGGGARLVEAESADQETRGCHGQLGNNSGDTQLNY